MLAEQEGGALWYQAIFQTAAPLLGYTSLAADKAAKRATFTATIRPVKPILPKLLDAFAAHDALEDALDSWLGWEFKVSFLPSASVTMSEANLRYWLGDLNQQLHSILEEAEISFQMLQSELQQEPASRHFLAANNTASGPGVFCRAVGPSLAAHLFCSPSDDFRATREVWLRFRELGRVLQELHDGVKPLLARAAGDDVEMWMIRPSGDDKNPQSSVRLMVQRFTKQMCKAAESCQDLLRKGPPDTVKLADHMQGAEAAFTFFCYTAKVSSEQYDALFSRRGEGLHGLLKAVKANIRRVEQHMDRLSSSLSQYRGSFGHPQPANVEESMMREIILQCQQGLQPFFYKEGEKVEEEPGYQWNEPMNV
ncbi:hypothetical protein GGTG_05043 [Gaeumannomyces tritici R3-111a-1]|uniref:Uncharacterized protein n=1 Tax=Gaeumannomyces tritici (strain R3-111a-1) TaxID=644352 RepID=J3NUT7_GAET3|nr:hypothetical protein GGTG_05043 [Gaeumannomyces tritici R3-111a-1]EJT79961.1 hypothetical protein GGTG_05043 [Gaeumannomyces tritici R3-111a-1]